MKLISRIFASVLCVAFLVPFTPLWQEKTLATEETCPGTAYVNIIIIGAGKNKTQAMDDLDYKIAYQADAYCDGYCEVGTCEVVGVKTKKVNCKYLRRARLWFCTTMIKRVECDCVDGVE